MQPVQKTPYSSRNAPAKETVCWLFCNVIDNFGDIGVAWRLACELRRRLGWQVHLWLDDLSALRTIAPDAPTALPAPYRHIVLHPWQAGQDADLSGVPVPDAVIETFACALPENVRRVIRTHHPLWLNWEYLSAEDWAVRTHAMPSLQADGSRKYFWQMGFSSESGGLLREADYQTRMAAFRQPEKAAGLDIFAFGYAGAVWARWCAALSVQPLPIRLHAAGMPLQQSLCAVPPVAGSLNILPCAFVPQAAFDERLWAADLLIVRGEDSFVRAQFSGRPFLWHIYPQEQDAHAVKLEAFWQTYRCVAPMDETLWRAHQALSAELNALAVLTDAERRTHWRTLLDGFAEWRECARAWQRYLLTQSDAVSRLAEFCGRAA